MSGTVTLHRVVRAPAERIYRAFLDPDAMCKWSPPHGFTGKVTHSDPRVGGFYKMSFTNFTTGTIHSFGGEYLELVPNERLRYTNYPVGSDLPDEPASHTTVDVHLEPEPDGRTRVELWVGDFAGLPNAVRRAREAGKVWVEALVGLKRESEDQARAMAA